MGHGHLRTRHDVGSAPPRGGSRKGHRLLQGNPRRRSRQPHDPVDRTGPRPPKTSRPRRPGTRLRRRQRGLSASHRSIPRPSRRQGSLPLSAKHPARPARPRHLARSREETPRIHRQRQTGVRQPRLVAADGGLCHAEGTRTAPAGRVEVPGAHRGGSFRPLHRVRRALLEHRHHRRVRSRRFRARPQVLQSPARAISHRPSRLRLQAGAQAHGCAGSEDPRRRGGPLAMPTLLQRLFTFLRAYFALLVVFAVFVWSAIVIAVYRAQQTPPGSIVIRLGHWQLEASVREGLDEMARLYRETHPNVIIIQDAIPEGTYGQWVSTQLMGGTAPDIMQVGAMLPDNIWLSYYNRYFAPLTRYVNTPNPHNAGTDIADMPLRQTFKDGMKTAYVTEMQEYMSIPLSLFGVRIFYNKDLLKKITGRDVAPLDYRDFLAVCQKIRDTTNPVSGQAYIPIAGSAYHFGHWDGMMFSPVTYGAFRRADFNRDGTVGNDETFVGFKTGLLDFHYAPYACWFKMIREVTDFFQTGYTGLGRDEAVFLFAQQRAVFMTTGTWDARSL
ncbi:MAG: carbohydrate ABC transporter substrate-binding protein, partial [Opitutae bacterium]|nr:carbohydrate ABC transporter substrate-binding protein [Opitutae bacterium]